MGATATVQNSPQRVIATAIRRLALRVGRTGTLASAIGAAATWGALACSGSGPTSLGPGTLTVTITAPGAVTPKVMVSGPGGFSRTLTATTTLTGLAAGSYAVTAAPFTTTDPFVGTVYAATVSGSPATVTASTGAATTATYTQRQGSGGLWVASDSNTPFVAEYSAAQLATEMPGSASATIGMPSGPFGPAFDANGNLWVPLVNENAIVEYTASQLGASGSPTPAVTLSTNFGSLNAPAVLAFDTSGNLWVSNSGINENTVVQFAASQLVASGSPAPAVTIGASGNSLSEPYGMAFDAHGNLWVGNVGASTVVEFTAGQLAVTGTPTPTVTLSDTLNSIVAPQALAFDADGNLWVANGDSNSIVEFNASRLTSTGARLPSIVLKANTGDNSIDDPTGLVFDNFGDLWVSNFAGPSAVVVFATSQIRLGGTPAPIVVVSHSALHRPAGLAFDPPPSALPLR